MRKRSGFRNRKAGFTLVEMLLVIGLIVILAGVAILNVDTIFGDNAAKLTAFKVRESFKTPLFKYRMDTGNYPTTDQGLQALLQKPSNVSGKWSGPYIEGKDDLVDAWGNELKYRYPSSNNPGSYDLYSLGPDGVESEDDIRNWGE
ncbi:type II secretion system major pseudopilin GspG [Pelagicoccus sp. SDUM812003]|uniref:type II secretion system major pseudopilin GspG n=1 Tax=Pelagicoccus sp. SDUM812003 TaxID=3041267 RepID=UPI00280E539A|nr:type II secretion system major pseudopilin GspG [Pelagicoccus sp. SDUM812003]MDQ8202959.1 type II secretion system major pseudopilin GspG [Pelagicoccus sp. SDUM812003]